MTPGEQLEDVKSRSNANRSVAVRQVQGGYFVNGSVQHADKETGGVLAAQNDEGVAATPGEAVNMVDNYLRYGSFTAPVQPPFNFDPAPTAPATI